ncbi:MAG TPA: Hpt domain-containing protein, partial [Rhodocyclaceae bacterium]|nr:Hpt domain-containing protein [Rhodocyclaceae bacterium]
MNNAAELDIGPLSWVKGEIDLALGRAAEALERHRAQGAQDGDSSHLKSARNNLHQAHGALSIVGLDGVTQFSDALEQLLDAVENGSVQLTDDVAEAAQHGLAAVRHYLDDLVAGQPDQPLRLLPAYRRLAAARGLAEPSPTELFFPDMSLRPPRREQEPAPVPADTLPRYLRAARGRFERGLLRWLRDRDLSGVAEMRQAVAAIEQSQVQAGSRAFWWVTLGVLDAMAAGGLPDDLAVRRLCGRIDIQMKRLIEGARTVAERLMRDTLYYVATSEHAVGDQVECVRAAYRLHGLIPKSATAADAEAVRPALRACHDLLAQAMDDWNRFCAGTAAALPQFHDRLSRLVT